MKTFHVVKEEYKQWIFHSRMLLVVCVWIFFDSTVTEKLVDFSVKMQTPLNILEPFLGICNSPRLIGFVPVIFLVLISDFPKTDQNMLYKIFRMGRKKWILSQCIVLGMMDVTYIFLLFAGITAPVLEKGFLYNGWSDVVVEISEELPGAENSLAGSLIRPNLSWQMPPYRAMGYTILLLALYLYMLGMLVMFVKLLGYPMAGTSCAAFLVAAGSGMAQFSLPVQWIFPAAHSLLQSHYSDYYRKMYCTLPMSILYFGGIIFLFWLGSFWCGRKMNYSRIDGMK